MDNKKNLMIFGCGSLAELLAHSVSQYREVKAHIVDEGFYEHDTLNGLPVIELNDQLRHSHPTKMFECLVSMGYIDMNRLRQERCEQLEAVGYSLTSYVHPSAQCWEGLELGANTHIYESAIIQPFVTLGKNVILRAGTNLGHHTSVGDHCFIASGVTTGGNVSIGDHCFIGLGATIRDGITIAPYTFVGAGSVVLGDTTTGGVYVGNPAKKIEKSAFDVTKG